MIEEQSSTTKRKKDAPFWKRGLQQATTQKRVQAQRSQTRSALVGAIGMALIVVALFSVTAQCVVPSLCVMEIRTDKHEYHLGEHVRLYIWLVANTNPDLPSIDNAQLQVELWRPVEPMVTLAHRENISLHKGAKWDELLLTVPVTEDPFRDTGVYVVHAAFLSQAGETHCEAYTSFIISRSSFGKDPDTRTLLVTSRRADISEPFVSTLAVWLEAFYRTEVHLIYQEGIYQVYQSGIYQDFDVLIYYAIDPEHSPPPELIGDIFESEGITKKKVVWIGYYLDAAQDYLPLYGLGYETLSPENGSEELLYVDSGVSYTLSQPDPICVEVTDDELARVRATVDGEPIIVSAKQSYYQENGECFYFVGFHPTAHLTPFGAHLVFCDMLNEVYGIDRGRLALVRLEDIHALTEAKHLLSVTSFLKDEDVPFTLALIPIYANEDGPKIHISWNSDFRLKVKRALLDGGELVLHGATHQYDGETARDFEFWDEENDTPIGDSEYALQRVADALIEIEFSELRPYLIGWETPHYKASDEAYSVFEEYFRLLYEHSYWRFYLHLLPYPVQRENALYVPTNLYYVRGEDPQSDVDRILEEARLLAGLQHGAIASFFYHPSLGLEHLEEILWGLQEQGWIFQHVSHFIDDK